MFLLQYFIRLWTLITKITLSFYLMSTLYNLLFNTKSIYLQAVAKTEEYESLA